MHLARAEEVAIAERANDPLWYKDAVIYQLHVKSFADSNNDGVGDFPGLIDRLDYLAELGVTAIWLLPFYPSPRRDDGYDIADYRGVHPDYGTIDDVRRFIDLAHNKGMRVITELVLNHTSDRHPWFQRARKAPPGSPERDFYVWSDTDKRYAGTRIIFLDTEKSNWTWDEEAGAYYWHRFYSHQPDLNFDNPAVLEEALSVMRFWLDMGVDGLRLDAVPYLVEREGTNNENLPETHAILKRIRAEVDAHYPGRMLLAEANQWPEDVQAYFGDGDECHMLFHFPLMPRMYMAIAQEDRFPIMDIMRQTPEAPDACQWATFLRNHDELTLEMVTDKERDYLWKTYAVDRRARLNLGIRRRLAPLLEQDRRRIELMNSLLLTIMGTPILYYGDELGMGDNIHLGDRDGVRTPMQWTSDRNGGFSRADPASLVLPAIMDPIYGYQAVNVEAQWRSPYSLLNWVRRMLVVRGRWKAFGRGTIRFLRPQNRKVLVYLREYEGETILCVANVSRTAQAVELDLSEFAGRTPVELSGEVPFPKIGQLTYLLTLQPFGFYWFSLSAETNQPAWSTATSDNLAEYHTFIVREGLNDVIAGRQRMILEKEILPPYVAQRRWYQNKSGGLPVVSIADTQDFDKDLVFSVLDVNGERYALPLAIAWEDAPSSPFESALALSRVRKGARIGLLTDGFAAAKFARAILSGLAQGCGPGALSCRRAPAFAEIAPDAEIEWPGAEQSNSTLIVGRAAVVKLFRRLVDGIHPEAEMVRELTERGFTGIAQLMGDVTYKDSAVAVVQRFVDNQGDGFSWSLEQVGRLIDDKAVADGGIGNDFEAYRNFIAVVGRRLGAMHTVLAQPSRNPDFAPETADAGTIETWRNSLRAQLDAAFAVRDFDDRDALAAAAERVLRDSEGLALTRIHGDLHLGQVLVAAGDAVIIDFEGEPAKPLAQRRAKNSPLRDVAGMLRSFDYVGAVVQRNDRIVGTSQSAERATTLLDEFGRTARAAFLEGYAQGRGRPLDAREERVLAVFALEKAAYEIVYEANNRPDWIDVPASGFARLAAAL
ncbi:MAG: maltose alpha-D-glucosyltransferase [Alphaproteobacteria bacterium]|nr:maltose alpha-D-glucosyltransferase [Alphaproteobacteria bacterium]